MVNRVGTWSRLESDWCRIEARSSTHAVKRADVPSTRLPLRQKTHASANWERRHLGGASRTTKYIPPRKPRNLVCLKSHFSAAKLFYDLRLDLRFVWYNGCELNDMDMY